jgi:hypothetical protein
MARKLHANGALLYYLVRRMPDSCATADTHGSRACYAPSTKYEHLARSSYGVGHTAWRQPGDMRGTVVGKKGRFRFLLADEGGDL